MNELFSGITGGDSGFTIKKFDYIPAIPLIGKIKFSYDLIKNPPASCVSSSKSSIDKFVTDVKSIITTKTVASPTVSSVNPVTGVMPNSFSISGSSFDTTGNMIKLTPTSKTSLVPSSVLQANTYSAFDSIWNLFKNLIPKAHGQTVSGDSFYFIGDIPSDGPSLTFSVPTTTPDGTYTVSVSGIDSTWTDTPYTITVTGNGAGDPTTMVTDTTVDIGTTPVTTPPTTSGLPLTVSATPVYSCPLTNNALYPLVGNTCDGSPYGAASFPASISGYTCTDDRYTLSGQTCNLINGGVITATSIPAIAVYYCPAEQSFTYNFSSNNTCYGGSQGTIPAPLLGYTCTDSHYTTSGTSCILNGNGVTTPTTTPSTTVYSCPVEQNFVYGLTASNSCYGPGMYSTILATISHTCPTGYSLSGTACNIVLTAPTSLISSATAQGQVKLSWSNNGATGITGVDIERSTLKSSGYSSIGIATSTTYTDTGLPPSTTYYYNVRIQYGSLGYGPYAATTTVTTLGTFIASCTVSPASLVRSPSASATWTSSVSGGPSGAYSYAWSWPSIVGVYSSVGGNTATYSYSPFNTSWSPSTRIMKLTVTSGSAATTTSCAPFNLLPVVPVLTIPAASVTATSIVLNWTDNDTASSLSSFNILSGSAAVATVGSSVNTYSLTGLNPSTQYCYVVQAMVNVQNSANSTSVCATTKAAPAPVTYTITPSYSSGGTISPGSATTVNSGSNQTFTITPSSGYKVSSVTVDGANAGAITSYTLSNVTANHTISASFAAIPATPAPAPTVSISTPPTFVPYGGTTLITWLSTNATSCYTAGGSGSWGSVNGTSGSFQTGALTTTTTYSITCSGPGGQSPMQSVTVNVQPQPIVVPQTTTVNATATYSCQTGSTLDSSGSNCTTTSTVPATATYSCPSGYNLNSGNTCSSVPRFTAPVAPSPGGGAGHLAAVAPASQVTTINATATYSCPSGSTLDSSGANCITTSIAPATATYSCPTGYTMNSDNTCTGTVSMGYNATNTASVWNSIVSWFQGLFR